MHVDWQALHICWSHAGHMTVTFWSHDSPVGFKPLKAKDVQQPDAEAGAPLVLLLLVDGTVDLLDNPDKHLTVHACRRKAVEGTWRGGEEEEEGEERGREEEGGGGRRREEEGGGR